MADKETADDPYVALARRIPRWAIIGVFLILAIDALATARAFLLPVLLALLLALVFSPLRRSMERLGVNSAISAFLITVTLLVGMGGLGLGLMAPISRWVDDAPRISREFETKLRDLRGAAAGMMNAAEQVEKITSGESTTEATEVGRPIEGPKPPEKVVVKEPGAASTLVWATPQIVGQVLFTLTLLFFLLVSGDMFYEKLVHVIPKFKDKRRAIRIARDIERQLSRYLLTITVINAGLGVGIAIAMTIIGMPSPLLFGVIAFLLNFVPYLGAIMGVALSFGVGVVSFDTVQHALIASGLYLSLTTIEGQFVTPYFVGRSLRLNTVMVFLSVTFWAWLWSIVGMLLATPLLVLVKTLCDHIPSLHNIGSFLSGRGEERNEEGGEAAAAEERAAKG
ncbi:AI-2E family transporter [Profundibacterium mesophilum]|uniref:AI-2E family transporter n=1 Tax=Profundibacterium mesophilum KAUST100406-0324 TaxID=1037889 RepID=A0A921NRQ4_9RHOB|nr:AI-2E family transporter [Profundibacterium mesophilum]KAF0676442.1 hypothetical protein PMES_01174 [Profundibacterium mesophilum KAUST100406-0324]